MRYLITALLVVLLQASWGQIYINEVGSKNDETIDDDYGESSDWIELYNASSEAIDLSGYYLSDEIANRQKWMIEDATIPAGGFLVVYASERDVRVREEGKIYTEISDKVYAYADSSSDEAIGNSYNEYLDYVDEESFTGNSPKISIRMNLEDNTGPDELGYSYAGIFHKFGEWGEIVDFSEYDRIVVIAQITEDRTVNARVTQDGLDNWEAYSVSLLGTGTNKIYEIPLKGDVAPLDPSIITGVEFAASMPLGTTDLRISDIRFYKDIQQLHTNFKLSGDGESLVLSDATGDPIDFFSFPALNTDHSFGRNPDGNSSFAVFTDPTPWASNTTSTGVGFYCDKQVVFNKPAGLYSGTQSIELSGSSEIRYTLDGSAPTKSSTLYTSPIILTSSTVIKAVCMENVDIVKDIYTNSYIIDHETELPVVSLSTNPDHLFSEETGIYADGPGWTSPQPHYGANFWQDWERPIHVEFFDQDGVRQIDQDAGVKIFGGWSRAHPQKSLRLKANKSYGKERFEYKFFHEKSNDSFKQIVLRNSGNDFNMTQMQDGFNQMLARNTHVDYLGFRPSIVFINGEYWGIMNIREKINDHYIEDNHGGNSEEVDLAGAFGEAIHGTNNIDEMVSLAQSMDLSVQQNFELVADSFDLENVIDYFSVNMFISNWDWPHNNLKFWRSQVDERKYRYILYDTDISLGLWNHQPASFNQLEKVLAPDPGDNSYNSPHGKILAAMLENEGFRNDFVNRYADLINTIYKKDNYLAELERLRDTIDFDIPAHQDRWNSWVDWETWGFDHIRNFIDDRRSYARGEVEGYFNLEGQVLLTLDVSPSGAGQIKISTIYPDEYPWSGVYFDGVPVKLEAIPNPGYTFENWESRNGFITNTTNNTQQVNFTSWDEITANFTGSESEPKITVSEINYNSDDIAKDPEDWLELWNYGTTPLDISYWKLKDSKDYNHVEFPSGTVIEPNERIIVVRDPEAFSSLHGNLEITSTMDFNLSNGGERVRLYDKNGTLYQDFTYDDELPWVQEPDGSGYTLELDNENGDLSDPSNWFAGCYGGSPLQSAEVPCAIITDLDQNLSSHGFVVYPNPTSGELNVILEKSKETGAIQLFNTQGLQVFETTVKEHESIYHLRLPELASGVYILTFNNGETTNSAKIMVY